MASVHRQDRYGKHPYRVRWRENGRQREKGFRTQGDANAFAHRIETNRALGLPVDPQGSKVEFVTYARRVIGRKLGTPPDKLPKNYESAMRAHVVKFYGDRSLADVATDPAAADELLNERMRNPKTGKLLSRNLRGVAKLILTRTVNAAVAAGDIPAHRLTDLELTRTSPQPPKRLTILTDEQITRFAGEMDRRYGMGIVVKCLYGLGLRISEVRGLERSDFSLDYSTLKLTAQATPDGKGRKAVKTESSVRLVPVPAGLRPQIEAHGPGPLVPGDKTGRRYLSEAQAYHRMRTVADSLGLDGWHSHLGRGQYSVKRLDGGQPPRRVASYMGHSSPAVTLRYYYRDSGKAEDDPLGDDLFGGWAA